MKKSFFSLVVFLIFCVIFTVFGAFAFMICFESFVYSVGTWKQIINPVFLLYGLTYSLPFAAIFSSIAMIFYIIKTETNKWMSFILYIFICLFIYLLVFPISITATSKLDQKFLDEKNFVHPLSKGYFRPTERTSTEICYIKDTKDDDKIDGILLENGKMTDFYNAEVSEIFKNKNDEIQINDTLLKRNLAPHGIIQFFIMLFLALLDFSIRAYKYGGSTFIAFVTIAVAMQSIYGYVKASRWRLFNGGGVLGMFLLITSCNLMLFYLPQVDNFINYMTQKNFKILSSRHYLQIIMNCAFFILNLVIGIVKAAKNPKANSIDNQAGQEI